MHIPDGYLSPSTCATLYVLAASGWYSAIKRVRRVLATRTIPLISVFAAFSFVVMMFNVPLPGGTTGHATGIAVASIVLGPSGSILATSIALVIQALFFGDGGITTLGANCFNMAVVGSVVAYGVYRIGTGNSQLNSRRRIVAAAIAGYVAINASALLAAIEFGIHPILFHDASGTPLYAPYPLKIAIPAVMLGHLTLAGLAEAAISAGMVSYLQHSDISLLRGIQNPGNGQVEISAAPRSPVRLWWIVAILMVCTPLGILAAGTAWGEWSSTDLANGKTRAQIEGGTSSGPSPSAPAGLERLSQVWTAPFPSYAPKFVRSASLGYGLSAMFGVGIIATGSLAARAIRQRRVKSS
jgi:cobalt/nickel transport system permease protein